MADYQLPSVPSNVVIRRADGAHVPTTDPAYVAWLGQGNTPDPADPLPPKTFDDQVHVRELQTTNATPVTTNFPLQSGTGYLSEISIVAAQDVSPFNSAGWTKKTLLGRAGGGAIIVGQEDLHVPFRSAGATNWQAVLSVGGNNAVLTLTGSATVINWTIKSTYFRVNKSGLVT